jgi:glutamyl-Q tRNA(Asp) synthetase
MVAHRLAGKVGGQFLVRMEDIDHTRVRPQYYDAALEDLSWLGLVWSKPVWRQLDRLPHYATALQKLDTLGVVYPCFCTRKDLAELSAPQEGDSSGNFYSGKCRSLSPEERAGRIAKGATPGIRLNASAAWSLARQNGSLKWTDRRFGAQEVERNDLDDVILGRKDIGTSYHLAVVVDDEAQGVTLVTRGEDLKEATPVHRLLQRLLSYREPEYLHHSLVRDEQGKRLAKRDADRSLRSYRAEGVSPDEITQRLVAFAQETGDLAFEETT